jgi:cAMP phosphodiesterase
VTGFLVRSTSSNWSKGSLLAVDAGSHLAAIQRILERDFPIVSGGARHLKIPPEDPGHALNDQTEPSQGSENDSLDGSNDSESRSQSPEVKITTLESGPFAGLAFPNASARANAVHVVREHVSTYLITHPHLDHLSGFAINTAAFHNTSRPKRLAALPFTVNAIKTHIFNDIVWPNLTDEDNGVGFVTFQRLTEGGNLALGEGYSRGFIEVCDGLAVKGFKVSHGRCSATPRPDYGRRGSNANIVDPGGAGQHSHTSGHAHGAHTHQPQQHNGSAGTRTPAAENRRASVYSQPSQPGTPTFYGGGQEYTQCVVDSSAFFIRADDTGKEILMFGDVEPDSISLVPRTHIVWTEAAPKIAQGILSGIFIECSYNDSQRDAVLFGHLAPRHLIKELESLAEMVSEKRKEAADKVGKKRKRHATLASAQGGSAATAAEDGHRFSRTRTNTSTTTATPARTVSTPSMLPFDETMTDAGTATPTTALDEPDIPMPTSAPVSVSTSTGPLPQPALELADATITTTVPIRPFDGPLKGVRVIVIHVKDTMADGPLVGESILQELWAHENRLAAQGRPLGCTFEVSSSGASYWF